MTYGTQFLCLLVRKNCSETPEMCHADATCSPVLPEVCAAERPIQYECVCNQGYAGDGTNCAGESKLILMVSSASLKNFYLFIFYLFIYTDNDNRA